MPRVSYPQKECAANVPRASEDFPINWDLIVKCVRSSEYLVVLVARLELARTYKVPRILSSAIYDLSTDSSVDNFFCQNTQMPMTTGFQGSFSITSFENLSCLRIKQKHRLRAVSVPGMCHEGES
jgi:hypothetical protein